MFLDRVPSHARMDVPGGFSHLYHDYSPVYQIMVGGMSEVWACLQRRSGQLVAVKRLLPHAMREWRQSRSCRYEAYALGSVRHPNILELLEKRYDAGSLCLITEFIPGINLAHFLNAWQLPVEVWVDLAIQLLNGLDALHEAGVTHGDIKPDNIMLMQREDGSLQVKLLDFGLALPLGLQWQRGTQDLDAAPEVLATAEYVAPELLMGYRPTPASDLYAVGHTFYHCLAGHPAFDYGELQGILNAQVNESAVSLHECRPGFPAALSRWIDWHLDKSPENRPESAAESRASLLDVRAVLESDHAESWDIPF